MAHCSGTHWGRWGQAVAGPCLGPLGRACKESLADRSEAPGPEPASCHKACRVRAYLQCTGTGTEGRQPLLTQELNAREHWRGLQGTGPSNHQPRHTPTVTWGRGVDDVGKSSQRLAGSTSATASTRPEGAESFGQKAVSQVRLAHGSDSSRSNRPHAGSASNRIHWPTPCHLKESLWLGVSSWTSFIVKAESRVKRKISLFQCKTAQKYENMAWSSTQLLGKLFGVWQLLLPSLSIMVGLRVLNGGLRSRSPWSCLCLSSWWADSCTALIWCCNMVKPLTGTPTGPKGPGTCTGSGKQTYKWVGMSGESLLAEHSGCEKTSQVSEKCKLLFYRYFVGILQCMQADSQLLVNLTDTNWKILQIRHHKHQLIWDKQVQVVLF